MPNIDLDSILSMKKLANQYPDFFIPMMGLHPCSVGKDVEEVLSKIKTELDLGGYIAVGEIGIDLHWDKTYFKEQQHAFRTQISWAKEKGLPIVIHARESFDEIFEILEEEKDDDLYGIFHCFTGTLEQAKRAISYNMKLGIGGVSTFKNGKIDQFLNQIDMSHIVLESDSPYLAPKPYRGKRNESLYINKVLEKLSELYDMSEETMANITTENSKAVFGI